MLHRTNTMAVLTNAGRLLFGLSILGVTAYAGICAVRSIIVMLWGLLIFLRSL